MTTARVNLIRTIGDQMVEKRQRVASPHGHVVGKIQRLARNEQWGAKMSSTVALLLRVESASAVEAIARCMPVWIAGTSDHAELKESLKLVPNAPPVTWFPLKDRETLEEAVVRITYSLDDHYNELAQKEAYKFLLVFGAKYLTSMETDLRELEFKKFEPTSFGFVAEK